IMAKYAPGAKASDQLYLYGVAKADTFVQNLYAAGKNLTRSGYMNAVRSMNSVNRFAIPGVVQKTGKNDPYIISQMQLERFNNGTWAKAGPLVQARPR